MPSFFGGLFVSQVKYAHKLRCPLGKKSTEQFIRISVICRRKPGVLTAMDVPLSGAGP